MQNIHETYKALWLIHWAFFYDGATFRAVFDTLRIITVRTVFHTTNLGIIPMTIQDRIEENRRAFAIIKDYQDEIELLSSLIAENLIVISEHRNAEKVRQN